MFKAVISRMDGCPWGDTGMCTADWLQLPVETVPIAALTATQDGVYFHALTGDPAPFSALTRATGGGRRVT